MNKKRNFFLLAASLIVMSGTPVKAQDMTEKAVNAKTEKLVPTLKKTQRTDCPKKDDGTINAIRNSIKRNDQVIMNLCVAQMLEDMDKRLKALEAAASRTQ